MNLIVTEVICIQLLKTIIMIYQFQDQKDLIEVVIYILKKVI